MTTPITDTATIETTRWRIDPARSSVEFHVKMLWGMMTVKGRFSEYEGTLDLSANPAIALTIDTASLDTGNEKRDEHLRSPGIFSVKEHPYVRFASEGAALDGERLTFAGKVHGLDATMPVSIEATLRPAGDGLELESVTKVDYRQMGVTWGKPWIAVGLVGAPGKLVVKGRLIPDS
jgi:polyisoprenoid-binding protein YceI